MSHKGSTTTATYLEWERIQTLIPKLERDGDWKFALLIAVGSYTGLRIGDILKLKWNDLLEQDILELTEQKTKKNRRITLNPQLKEIVSRIYKSQKGVERESLIFLNRFGKVALSRQYINTQLKEIAAKYKLTKDVNSIKSHSLRKTFGRRVFEVNDRSERALILLSDILQHSSVGTTEGLSGHKGRGNTGCLHQLITRSH